MTGTNAVPVTAENVRAVIAAAWEKTPSSWVSLPWKVVPADGKPIIVSSRVGNLFRGYVATWHEADLIVAVVNALPTILAALASPHRPATEWRCFHCGDVFTDERCARLHFGRDEDSEPACIIKAGAEQGLLGLLRQAEYAAADARQAIADESTDAAKAYYAQATRHDAALRNAEELGYERGLADARSTQTQSREAIGRAVHEALSRANVNAYLDMPDDTADRVAVAILALQSSPAKAEGAVPVKAAA